MENDNYIQISQERQEELIKMMKEAIKEDKLKDLFKIFKNDADLDFMYSWLYENNITRKGRNGNRISSFSLTSEQNIAYAKKIEAGDMDAKAKMIVGNLNFASWYVKNKIPNIFRRYLNEEDLEQIAAIGIMEAVERFDYRKGSSFATYATYWIREKITREIEEEGNLYKIPANKRTAIFSKLNKAENEFKIINGREPFSDELADSMKMSPVEIEQLQKVRLRYHMLSTEELSEKAEEDLINSLLDTDKAEELENRMVIDGVYVDEQEEAEHETVTIEYNGENNPESLVLNSNLNSELAECLSTLTEIEQDVLIKRYGLGDEICQTLTNIAKEKGFGITKISQIENKALRRLRHPYNSRKLKVFQGIEYRRIDGKTIKDLLDEKRKENTVENIRTLRAKEKELDAQIIATKEKELANEE